MSSMKYNDYIREYEEKHIDEEKWNSVKEQSEITLLIGAGVTSCLVGSWDELLNELAVLRGVSGITGLKPQELRDYLTSNCNGCFFPADMNVLEKGEYLRYSPTDCCTYVQKDKIDQWREKVFAKRVLFTVNRLIYRHLCDGARTHVVDDSNILNYKKDFMNWCRNEVETPFHLRRRILCNNKNIEEELKKFSTKEIIDNLNSWYGIFIDKTVLQTLINSGADISDSVYTMFSNIFKGHRDNTFRKQIGIILKNKDLEGKSPDEKIRLLLVKVAAYLLWRPGYETLETLLTMCIYRKVTRVITYNFDTIFDRLLNDSEVQDILKQRHKTKKKTKYPKLRVSVYGITHDDPYELKGFETSKKFNSLPIVHVHGIVDEEISDPETIIFSETSYLSYQQFLLNPGGMKLAEACRRGSLLCVGFSGVDTNFRSIIRQITHQVNAPVFSNDRKNKVYLTRSLEEVNRYYHINENMPKSAYQVAFQCANTFLDMLKHYYQQEVEVDVLLAKDFTDLSDHLKTTFEISDL